MMLPRWFVWNTVFFTCLTPLAYVVYLAVGNHLGPDPAKALVLALGGWAIRFLAVTLTMTPAAQLLKWSGIIRYRRMIGLYSWFYALLHVTAYALFLLDWGDLWKEISKRPYIFVGLTAFIILTALTVTSNRPMMRKLGKRWKALHRWVYLAALLVCLHVIWIARSDYGEAVLYSSIFGVLLGYRIWKHWKG